jgi:hypothetical protein
MISERGSKRLTSGSLRRATLVLATVAALVLTLTIAPAPAGAAQETRGTDFWIAFDRNYSGNPELTIFISGDTATSGEVTPFGMAAIPYSVTPGAVTSVPVPSSLMIDVDNAVSDKGIHVTAGAPVSVYGLNRIQFTTDAFLAIPTEDAGTQFRVLEYAGGSPGGAGIVATQDGTVVTINPVAAAGANPAGVPFDVNLNTGQTYQLAGDDDMSGSTISSNKPISVYGYNPCTNIPPGFAFCDHIVEQLPPTSAWGTSFLSARLANRAKGDTYRILADQDGTVVTINGTEAATLGAGEFFEAIVPGDAVTPSNTGVAITTSKPALVAQYSNGTSFDGVQSDPFMMLVPPFEQFQSGYTVTTPASGFSTNFINVVVPTASIGDFTLDGATQDPAAFAPIGTSGFSSAQFPVALGSHNLDGSSPFGVFVYGFAQDDSYGYPGGYRLSPVAAAATLTLDQPAYSQFVGGNICPIATVRDDGGNPLEGITVSFEVDSPAFSGTGVTNAAGQTNVCFTSAAVTAGTLTASAGLSIGTLTATATVEFIEEEVVVPVVPAQVVRIQPTFTG